MVERKAQGLHCGPLPFGVMKGQNWVPVPATETYPCLLLAFELAAAGKSAPQSGSARSGSLQIPNEAKGLVAVCGVSKMPRRDLGEAGSS